MKFRYFWQYHLGWFPLQPCLTCRRWYWGGLPFEGWRASYQTYCSKRCHDAAEY